MLDPELSLDLLAAEGKLTVDACTGRLDEAIPFCPAWTGRDLALHLAGVYRWVTAMVGGRLPEPPDKDLRAALYTDPNPADDAGVLGRLQLALDGVVDVLRAGPVDLDCWTIWPGYSPRDFWIRRQLHETLVHRVDAQNLGRSETDAIRGAELDTTVAADGVDEMMLGFSGRYRKLRHPEPVTLAVHATDAGAAWWCTIGPESLDTGGGAAPGSADAALSGRAGELLLWLWNRRSAAGLEVSGDPTVLEIWTSNAHL
ncbi:MAG TPA: maleylpyruvate isomerase family mycothiol-dependent enzyme [Sporichthyaceae bacterium]